MPGTASSEPQPSSSFSLNPAAASFTPSFPSCEAQGEPSASPIAMPPRSTSPFTRHRSSSGTSTLNVASSATPRGLVSPLAQMQLSSDSSSQSASSTQSASIDPPAALAPPRPTPPSRASSTASSAKGYDPTVLRNLIATACAHGDLERLRSLLSPAAAAKQGGAGEAPSTFALANQTSPHTGLSPLHYAAQKGHVDVVQWLIEAAGAMPELEDLEGETPLHKAAHRGHLDVCRFLIASGADVNAADNDGWTALHNAASHGWLDVARLLIDAGASVDQPNKHRYTALMNAAAKGQLPLVHFLLKRGADPLARNAFGETAYDLAAAVFQVQIVSVLAAAEEARVKRDGAGAYNPLAYHSTVPVVLYENQRLALPSLKKLSTLAQSGTRWSSKALSRNDGVAAFSMPRAWIADGAEDDLPCFRTEVALPVIGDETHLGLPEPREVRSGGRVRAAPETAASSLASSSSPSAKPTRPRPQPRRASSSAASSLTAILASSPSLDPAAPATSASSSSPPREPAWFWLSDWVVDPTFPSSSSAAHDAGWSYAPSFPSPDWSPSPPLEAQRALSLDGPASAAALAALAGQGKKFVRRRRWVRLMRRRVDRPDFGFPDGAGAVQDAGREVEMDYRARARFLAGEELDVARGDGASVTSARTIPLQKGGEVGADELVEDRVALRKVVARLERAADELRRGMSGDEDETSRRSAQDELEALLQRVGLLKAQLGEDEDDDDDSDEEFVYSGQDADNDDARSVWTATRPSSITSASIHDSAAEPTASTSAHPVLTPQIAPEFRVPTHEHAPLSIFPVNPLFQPRPIRARWQPDEEASDCRRCGQHFTFFKRKHHCRRCGFVVCASCSPHEDALDPYTVALEPGTFMEEQSWLTGLPMRYRTCGECHAALSLPSGVGGGAGSGGTASLLSPQAFFPASPSLGSVTPSEAAASDASDLVECPVCGTALTSVGDKAKQEEHIRDCLETGGGSISSGRYLVFKLPPGPLVGEECGVCFEDFDVGDKMARLVCLCTFHETCISSWLSRGHSCPVHPQRES
ncbi:uncharacterized protein JCM10292_004304 [Rhodotorula paludigena]|uniref:uncharacterized protein n=1 Tax=Rhodotorula paludigena TaxID=86838 RepID=UPI00317E44C8